MGVTFHLFFPEFKNRVFNNCLKLPRVYHQSTDTHFLSPQGVYKLKKRHGFWVILIFFTKTSKYQCPAYSKNSKNTLNINEFYRTRFNKRINDDHLPALKMI